MSVSAIRLRRPLREQQLAIAEDPDEADRIADARETSIPPFGIFVATQTKGERSMNWRVSSLR